MLDPHTLVINADDFGLDKEIDRAIIELARQRQLSAVSVLVSSDSFSEARLFELLETDVSIGVHLALTETRPLSPGFPTAWLDTDGKFPLNWSRFFARSLYKRIDFEKVYGEWVQQYLRLQEMLAGSSKQVTFLDSHQNVHFWPIVAAVAKKLQDDYSIPLMRVFRDNLRIAKPLCSTALLLGAQLFKDRHLLPCYGIHQSGCMDFDSFTRIVENNRSLGRGGVVVTHPGHRPLDRSINYSLSWEAEYSLLSSGELRDWLAERKIQIVNVEQLFA